MELTGRRVLVLGIGRFGGGLGVARWLLDQGAEVTASDLASAEQLGPEVQDLAARGARLVLGGHAGLDPAAFELLVVNPAVPPRAPLLAAARAAGTPVTTEIGLLLERWPGPVVGVTGSNGKSTTVTLTAALLAAAGRTVHAGGNLGGSLLGELERAGPESVAVLELSSFMLEHLAGGGLPALGPEVAVITNLTPNHLDWHGGWEAYRDAKAAILARARLAVLPDDDPVLAGLARPAGCATAWFGRHGSGSGAAPSLQVDPAGNIVQADGTILLESAAVPLPGTANRLDLAAAWLACAGLLGELERPGSLAAGSEVPVRRALAGLELPPHRMEPVPGPVGITWLDDSVSTTPESTAASLEAVEGPCLLIAGGHDKGLDPGALLEAAARRTRVVLTVGEQGPLLARRLAEGGVAAEEVGSVAAAVVRAAALARPGDTVLLSPGYSSHDQFRDFTERARAFREAVAGLAPAGPCPELAEEC